MTVLSLELGLVFISYLAERTVAGRMFKRPPMWLVCAVDFPLSLIECSLSGEYGLPVQGLSKYQSVVQIGCQAADRSKLSLTVIPRSRETRSYGQALPTFAFLSFRTRFSGEESAFASAGCPRLAAFARRGIRSDPGGAQLQLCQHTPNVRVAAGSFASRTILRRANPR